MHLLTLSDLKPIVINKSRSLVSTYIQQQFQLTLKQTLMGLPVEPILDKYPQLKQWICSLRELLPSLFIPHKKLFIDLTLTAQLECKSCRENRTSSGCNHVIEVRTNVGIVRERPRLFEWGIRHPLLSYSDRIKLWVATEYFQINPNEMRLTVLALHPTEAAQKVVFSWDSKQHKRTRNWLIKRINEKISQPYQPSIAIPKSNTDTGNVIIPTDDTVRAIALVKSIDEIDEVPL
ncbi:hypothetical protein IQ264_01450 [Phormidium sp. LEGE 05292]|uniref:hypothetical protein n=1 Tax=[Phormidium] sp. LEGE 05292 TaxID=767427 RepID=UPI00187E20CA|nr:hypothetical protein [Phormidium sp. LEGE 05292]MBE9224138.1 hypothetical protein [Phormidium sp. LEGE 05292]